MKTAAIAIVLAFVLLTLFPAAAAEEEADEPQAESGVWKEILELYEKAKDAGEKVPKDVYQWVKQDIKSVEDWEYLVFDMQASKPDEVQERLNELGTDRWECIWIQESGRQTRFVLKRPAKSYLKHIPLSQLMKLVPSGDSGE